MTPDRTDLRRALAHILWIGGATDAGKTTVSGIIADRYRLKLYNYDQRDVSQTTRLAETVPRYRAALDESPARYEQRLHQEPEERAQASLRHMRDRFPLVVEELIAFPKDTIVVAEGFGLTPELVFPVISNVRQAIWLISTEEFKRRSMQWRGKPSWRNKTSDPEQATEKFFMRDTLLAAYFQEQARSCGLSMYEVDGSQSAEEVAAVVEHHFSPFLPQRIT